MPTEWAISGFLRRSKVEIFKKSDLFKKSETSLNESILTLLNGENRSISNFVAIRNCTDDRLSKTYEYDVRREPGHFFYGSSKKFCSWQIDVYGQDFCVIGPYDTIKQTDHLDLIKKLVASKLVEVGVNKPPALPDTTYQGFKRVMRIVGMGSIADASKMRQLLTENSFLAIEDTGTVLRKIKSTCKLIPTHGCGYRLTGFDTNIGIFQYSLGLDDWIVIGPGNAQRPKPDLTGVTVKSLKTRLIRYVYPREVAGTYPGTWQVQTCPGTEPIGPRRASLSHSDTARIVQEYLGDYEDDKDTDESLYQPNLHRRFDTDKDVSVIDAECLTDYKKLRSLLDHSKYLAVVVTGERYTDSVIFSIEQNCELLETPHGGLGGYEANSDNEHNWFKAQLDIFYITIFQTKWMIIGPAKRPDEVKVTDLQQWRYFNNALRDRTP